MVIIAWTNYDQYKIIYIIFSLNVFVNNNILWGIYFVASKNNSVTVLKLNILLIFTYDWDSHQEVMTLDKADVACKIIQCPVILCKFFD